MPAEPSPLPLPGVASRRARPSWASTSSRSTGSAASIERFGERFSKRVLTPTEQRYVRMRPETFAGRWAAKEAVSKVLGLGVRGHRLAGHRGRAAADRPAVRPAPRPGRGAGRAARDGADRPLDQPRVRLRGRDRVRRPDGGRPLRLPARHRGPARRSRAAPPRPDGAAPRAPRGETPRSTEATARRRGRRRAMETA